MILDLIQENLLISVFIGIIVIFILFRMFKTMRMYLGAKSFVKKSLKQDKKKFNGIMLVEKITKKRKKNTNSFKKLRGRAKKWVRKYLTHKLDQLPIVARYSKGTLFKRSKSKLLFLVKNERKTIKKMNIKKGQKQLLELTNKYDCLDELITFLHHLPNAILNDEEYDIFFGEEGLLLTYQIK